MHAKNNCGAGAPTRYGVYSLANDGHSNYGIYGIATGGANSYGVRGHASGAGTNNWAGYFSGSVYTTGTYEPSDARLKTDVRSLRGTGMLARLMQLEPRQFRYRNAQALRAEGLPDLQFSEGDHLGLLAEEVELVFPEVVIDVVHPLDDGDQTEIRAEPITTKAINYIELIPVLIEAIREQQVRIDALEEALQAQGRE